MRGEGRPPSEGAGRERAGSIGAAELASPTTTRAASDTTSGHWDYADATPLCNQTAEAEQIADRWQPNTVALESK